MKENFHIIFVAGVHKGGTTSMYKYLSHHSQIFAPLKKEIHFFTPLVYDQNTSDDREYFKHFKEQEDQKYVLDVSPSYLYGGKNLIDAINETAHAYPIVLLRNPVNRFVSFYKQGIITGSIDKKESLSDFFEKSLKAFKQYEIDSIQLDNFYNRSLREGCYSLYIGDWLEYYGNKLQLIFFEDFITRPEEIMGNLCRNLGMAFEYHDFEFHVENKSFKPKNQRLSRLANSFFLKNERFFRKNKRFKNFIKGIYTTLNRSKFEDSDEKTIDRIREFYQPFNQEFNQILNSCNRKTPHWDT